MRRLPCLAMFVVLTGFTPYKSGDNALHWDSDEVALTLVQKDSPLTLSAFRDLVNAAFSQWANAATAVPRGTVRAMLAEQKSDSESNTSIHQVQFLTDAWPYDPSALAVTVFSYKKSTATLVDADIYVNGTGPCISDAHKDASCYDLQAVLTHEAGHFLGLDHNSDELDSVMYPSAAPGNTDKRVLTEDDAAGVAATYGGQARAIAAAPAQATATSVTPQANKGSVNQEVPVRQGCSATGASSAWYLLALLALARRAKATSLAKHAKATLAIVALVLTGHAEASSVARETIAQQVDRSDVVFVGRAVASRSYFEQSLGFIVTEHTLAIDECIRGDCNATVTFRTLGGEVGDLMTRVSGEIEPVANEQALFVASRRQLRGALVFESTAFGQGVLTLDRDLNVFRTKTQFLRLDEVKR